MKKLLRLFALLLLSLTMSTIALASEMNIYDQPNTASKVVGKVDLSAGVILIYTPKNSDWLKVADPRNGNVGWIKSSDMNKQMGSSSGGVTFTQKIISNGKGQHSYQVTYGQPQKVTISSGLQPATPEQVKKIQTEQLNAQHQLQETLQNAVKRMNDLTQQLINQMNGNAGQSATSVNKP